jgi:hypothetical protein
MVYNIQNYWLLGLCPTTGILQTRDTRFRKLDLIEGLILTDRTE